MVEVFQSPSDPKAGCNVEDDAEPAAAYIVSIPIRPEGRMQPCSSSPGVGWMTFQSPSDPKAGCNGLARPRPVTRSLFQSPSDPKAGCNVALSIIGATTYSVSIPIRPEGRMQPNIQAAQTQTEAFQSPSDPKAGCNRSFRGARWKN